MKKEFTFNIKEPIFMRLLGYKLPKNEICNNLEIISKTKLLIPNISDELKEYIDIWKNKNSNILTGAKTYPLELNIEANMAYEFMTIETVINTQKGILYCNSDIIEQYNRIYTYNIYFTQTDNGDINLIIKL